MIQKEFSWCPGPESLHVVTSQLLPAGSGHYSLMGRAGGQSSGEPGLGPDRLFEVHRPCLPITPVSPLLSGLLLKPLLKVLQDAGA